MNNRLAEGYDIPAVEAWVGKNIKPLAPPFIWTRLEGGHSNLTYMLEDANGMRAVIRRPPQGKLLPNAHDMSREWALISALGSTCVPVPKTMGFCDDANVTGACFYVMGVVEGRPLYSAAETLAWVPEDRRLRLAHSFVDVLADLHALNPDEIGLGELGKKTGYVDRQIKTWYRSWTASLDAAQFDDARAHELKKYFVEHTPQNNLKH